MSTNIELKTESIDAARVNATAKCLVECRGKLIHLPSTDEKQSGQAVWSGLITRLQGNTRYN